MWLEHNRRQAIYKLYVRHEATIKCDRNVNRTEDFCEYLGNKPSDDNMYSENLFRMLTLTTDFKAIEISEVVCFVNNYYWFYYTMTSNYFWCVESTKKISIWSFQLISGINPKSGKFYKFIIEVVVVEEKFIIEVVSMK